MVSRIHIASTEIEPEAEAGVGARVRNCNSIVVGVAYTFQSSFAEREKDPENTEIQTEHC
jgi:hypothetical protein